MGGSTGGFIWYELMTPDPAAAKRFYDAVVGWDIAENSVAPGIEYRMIGRSDGGNAGGAAHGAYSPAVSRIGRKPPQNMRLPSNGISLGGVCISGSFMSSAQALSRVSLSGHST